MTWTRWRKQFRSVRETTRKSVNHFTADFVTTRSGRSANRDAQILWPGTIFTSQTFRARDSRSRECATPTSVNSRKRTRSRIADQNRYAISRFHSRENFVCVADNHVAIDRFAKLVFRRLCFFHRTHNAHVRAVDLPATREGPLARKKLEKAAAILQNVLRHVIVKSGEAQRIVWHITDATQTRGESVYKTILLEWQANKRAEPVKLAPVKSSFA